MSSLNEKNDILNRTNLEMEFSKIISGGMDRVILFLQTARINSVVVYAGQNETGSLPELFRRLTEQNIAFCAAVPYDQQEIYQNVIPENAKIRFRISSPEELSDFLAKKKQFPGVAAELYYNEQRCAEWNISGAMAQCREHSVECIFGCSESFISVSTEKLEILCGGKQTVPFPGEPCLRYVNSLFLAGDGTLYPCYGMRALPILNIFAENMEELFQNSTALNFYNNYTKEIKTPCKSCSDFGRCGGCRGRAHRYSADFLAADPACLRNQSVRDKIVQLPVKDPENYLPHKVPMLMVSELTEIQDSTCEVFSVIQPENPFLQNDGTLHPAAFVEIGAQSMAFLDTFLHPDAKLQGMLVEINQFHYHNIPVRAGDRVRIFSRKIYEMPPWNIGSFEIYTAENCVIATGEIKVCQFSES